MIAVPTGFLALIAIVELWTGSLNVAVTVLLIATFVAPDAGVRPVTVGGVVSVAATVVSVQLTGSIRLPAASFAPLTLTV